MKRQWEAPVLEVLKVKETMKGWKYVGGGLPGHEHDYDCDHLGES